MITLHLTATFDKIPTLADARIKLDAFREAVQPSMEYGITLSETAPPPARTFTMQQAAQAALDVQSGCNLSGIVRSFAEITAWMRASGLDTPTTNTHPVSRLFAEQIAHLTNAGTGDPVTYSTAYDACQTLAKGGD